MSGSTAKYGIPYAQSSDTVAGLGSTSQNQANRVDLLLGEAGQVSTSVVAATTESKVITLARTYPGNTAATVPGFVFVNLTGVLLSTASWNWWITTWVGSGTTITGFTLNYQFTTNQAARPINWRFLPVL